MNPKEISPAEATIILRKKLIDQAYFYPENVGIPLFIEHMTIGSQFSGWYEFEQFSIPEEDPPTAPRTLDEFFHSFQK